MPNFESGASAAIIVNGRDESRLNNKANVQDGREILDTTTFQTLANAKEFAYGLSSGAAGFEGFSALENAVLKEQMATTLGKNRDVHKIMMGPHGLLVGLEALFFEALSTQFSTDLGLAGVPSASMQFATTKFLVRDGICLHALSGAQNLVSGNEIVTLTFAAAPVQQFLQLSPATAPDQVFNFRLNDYATDALLKAAIKAAIEGMAKYAGRTVTITGTLTGATGTKSGVLTIEFDGAVAVDNIVAKQGAYATLALTSATGTKTVFGTVNIVVATATAASVQADVQAKGGQFAGGLVFKTGTTGDATYSFSFPVGATPALLVAPSIATPASASVYFTDGGANAVKVFDSATGTLSATIPMGGFPSPFLAMNAAKTRVYVPVQFAGTVKVIDTATGNVTATIPVGNTPMGVAVTPSGAKVFVANRSDNTVSVIDTTSNTVSATVNAGAAPYGVLVSPDGTRVYVSNESGNSVTVINAATNAVVTTVAVGTGPRVLAISPDGAKLYVANTGTTKTVSVITTASNTVTGTITPAAGVGDGLAISSDGAKLYISGTTTISVYNTTTVALSSTLSPAAQGGVGVADIRGLLLNGDGQLIVSAGYVPSGSGPNYVVTMDTGAGTTIGGPQVSSGLPFGMACISTSAGGTALDPTTTVSNLAAGVGTSAIAAIVQGGGVNTEAVYNAITASGTDDWVDNLAPTTTGYAVRSHVLSLAPGAQLQVIFEHTDGAGTPNLANVATLTTLTHTNTGGLGALDETATVKRYIRARYVLTGASALFCAALARE
jgi:YVTN family beta-propeller protein